MVKCEIEILEHLDFDLVYGFLTCNDKKERERRGISSVCSKMANR